MSGRAGRTGGLLALVAAWSAPALAFACPVCFSAKDEANRVAIFVSTMFMTALPLVLLGSFIAWVARRARDLDAQEQAEHSAAAGDAVAAKVLPLTTPPSSAAETPAAGESWPASQPVR